MFFSEGFARKNLFGKGLTKKLVRNKHSISETFFGLTAKSYFFPTCETKIVECFKNCILYVQRNILKQNIRKMSEILIFCEQCGKKIQAKIRRFGANKSSTASRVLSAFPEQPLEIKLFNFSGV